MKMMQMRKRLMQMQMQELEQCMPRLELANADLTRDLSTDMLYNTL